MNGVIQPEAWSDFWAIWLVYLPFGFAFSVLLLLIGAVPITAVSKSIDQASKLIANLAGFLTVLVPVGAFFAALWSCTIWGRMYVTQGADTEDDFSVILPINSSDIAAEHGQLLTGTIDELQLMWLAYAALAWAISFLIYRIFRQGFKKLNRRQVHEDDRFPRSQVALGNALVGAASLPASHQPFGISIGERR